jgi:hypothetical protein
MKRHIAGWAVGLALASSICLADMRLPNEDSLRRLPMEKLPKLPVEKVELPDVTLPKVEVSRKPKGKPEEAKRVRLEVVKTDGDVIGADIRPGLPLPGGASPVRDILAGLFLSLAVFFSGSRLWRWVRGGRK